MQQPLIALDCERMRHAHTGLYHFCWHLSKALYRQLPKQYDLLLYLPKALQQSIAGAHPILPQHPWHQWLLHPAKKTALWHCTNQGSTYFPNTSKCKVVLNVHDLNFLYDNRKSGAKQQRYLSKLQSKLQRADAVVAISEYVRRDLLQHTTVDPQKISVIYNGCNIDPTIQPQAPKAALTAPFLFTIGTIVDKKNFRVLPQMLQGNNYNIVIAGAVQSEAYKQRIIAEAAAVGAANRVSFTGPVTEGEKYWYLQHCSAFVFPSLSEGFGLPVIEAMHFGKPVLLSKATSLPEVGGPHAYYFDDFSATHMSNLLRHAVNDVVQNNKQQLIQDWAAKFSWDAAAKAYINIYQQLLGRTAVIGSLLRR